MPMSAETVTYTATNMTVGDLITDAVMQVKPPTKQTTSD